MARLRRNLRAPPLVVAENSKRLRLNRRAIDAYDHVAHRRTLPEPLTTYWGCGIGRWQQSDPFHALRFPTAPSMISGIEVTGSARKVDVVGHVRQIRRRPAGGAGAGAVVLTGVRNAADVPCAFVEETRRVKIMILLFCSIRGCDAQ